MKKTLKNILSCIITLCLTVGLLSVLTRLMERKSSYSKYADFFSQKPDFEVLFMGSSHVINAVYPMELWDDFGIVSYNFGGHSNKLATTYWTMENAFDYTTPKVVVIDALSLTSSWKSSDSFSFLHLSLDAFPTTMTKIRAIWDLLDDPGLEESVASGKTRPSDEPRTRIGLLWDYSVYHNRWNELTDDDFHPAINLEKGAESRSNVVPSVLERIDPSKKNASGSISEAYLRKAIEDCKARGIDVLLTFLPFPASSYQQRDANLAGDIAAEYGINYINFLDLDLVNYVTDCYDSDSHLNQSGARKVTDYLGKYLMEHYDVKDQRSNPDYAFWYEDYREYVQLKNENLNKQNNINVYLMMLTEEKADVIIDVRKKDFFRSSLIMSLLANLGIDTSLISDDSGLIIIRDQGKRWAVIDNPTAGEKYRTDAGTVEIISQPDGGYGVLVDSEDWLYKNSDDKSGVQINVIRNHSLADSVHFTFTYSQNNDRLNVSKAEHDSH